MPDAPEGDAEDKGDAAADVAFAWFGTGIGLPQPAPALLRLPVGAKAIQLPDGQATAGIAAPLPGATQLAADPAPAEATSEAPAPDAVAVDPKLPAPPVATSEPKAPRPPASAEPERPAAPIRTERPAAQEQAMRVQPATLAAAQPRAESVQPLAAPLAAAAIEAPSPRRTAREATISALSAPTADAPRPHAVPATPDAQQPALDMRRQEWMHSMVERIEALRDSSGPRETSIRLSPDALGTVDVSIRHDGDSIHVRFTAETPAARAALAEAQPRLAELAESRGLRLGQTSVDGGAAGHGQRHDAPPRPAFTSAPASAQGGESTTDTDERIA